MGKRTVKCAHKDSVKDCEQCWPEFSGENMNTSTEELSRIEVIDETGRAYVRGSIYNDPVKVELSVQDDGRTLKIFVTPVEAEVKGEVE